MKKMIYLFALIIAISFQAKADVFKYECFSYYWNGDTTLKGTMELTVDQKSAQAIVKNEDEEVLETSKGPRNEKYKSRGSIRYAKFGTRIIVEEALLEGGRVLNDGQKGGFARYEGEAEGGFFQYKFICKSR